MRLLKLAGLATVFLIATAGMGRAEAPDYAAAERFTPKEVYALLYGEAAVDRSAGRRDSFARAYRFNPDIVRPSWQADGNGLTFDYQTAEGSFRATVDVAARTRTVGRIPVGDSPDARQPGVPAPDGSFSVTVVDHNIVLVFGDGSQVALTSDGEPGRSFGTEDGSWDSQKALPARLGWLPGGRRFWVERWDNREVAKSWILNSLASPRPALREFHFAAASEGAVPVPELWIFDADHLSAVQVDTARWPRQFVGNMDIGVGTLGKGIQAPEGTEEIFFVRMSPGYKDIELVAADPGTGRARVILHEKADPYFTIRFPIFRVLSQGSEILWLSDRDGYNHLYLYCGDGKGGRQITSGEFMIENILHVDEAARTLIVSGYGFQKEEHPHYRHHFRVHMDTGEIALLNPEPGYHHLHPSPDGAFMVDTWSRPDQPPVSVLRDRNGSQIMSLHETDISALKAAGWQPPRMIEAVAADGETRLYGSLWAPFGAEEAGQVPVLVNPQPNPSGYGNFALEFYPTDARVAFSQLGFGILASSTRGQAQGVRPRSYLTFSHGNVRDYPLADSLATLKEVGARFAFLDMDRVGVFGYSGGAFMSAALLMTYPEVYKAGASGSGNHDNSIAEMNSGEYYFGLGHEDGAGVDTTAQLAGALEAPFLIYHGDSDTDTHFSHSIRLADALIEAGKAFDFVVYPGQDHDLADDLSYEQRRLWVFFGRHLMNDRWRANLYALDQ